jgi:hypothetical protein
MNIVVTPGACHMKLPPEPFHNWATQFLNCSRDLTPPPPDEFSPVSYYLLCHAIELEIKSRLSKTIDWKRLKKEYCHDLIKAYNALNLSDQILSDEDKDVLKKTNVIYKGKGFEYIIPINAVTGYRKCPKLELLDSIASKLIETK